MNKTIRSIRGNVKRRYGKAKTYLRVALAKKRNQRKLIYAGLVSASLILGTGFIISINQNMHANVVLQARQAKLKGLSRALQTVRAQKATSEQQLQQKAANEATLQKQIEDLNKQLQAKAERQRQESIAARVVNTVTQTRTAYAAPAYGGSHADWMAAAGIRSSDYSYVDYIVSHESGWRINASNPSGAYGLCQALPGSKMASAGGDWASNPVTQLRWCDSYAQSKGGWAASYNIWVSKGWW